MRIVIAGGTGFLGRPLSAALLADGHDLVFLTRGPGTSRPADEPAAPGGRARVVTWAPNGQSGPWAAEVDGAGAVINLAGEPIAARRWTAAQKARILDSRLQATGSLVRAVTGAALAPPVFVSGSAVGYYGPLGDKITTEEQSAGVDFLASVCAQWENEARRAAGNRTRVVCLRTGLVLEADGGALPQMLPPFRLGVGGPLGSGRQYWPWIHREDWVALVRWIIDTPSVTDAVNATAPNPVTNADFARALGLVLRRPSFMPAPGFALRLLLGEMADGLLLSGQRATPSKAERLGFRFRFATLDEALHAIFRAG